MHRARDGGLIGVGELSPHSQGFALDDPVFREVLTLASDWMMPVNLHVTDPRLAREFPTVTFILAHWGGALPLHDTSAATLTNVFYDTAASPLLYDESIWRRFAAVVPEDRVLFGSDYPLNLYPKRDAKPEMSRLIAEAKAAGAGAALLGGNAERMLTH